MNRIFCLVLLIALFGPLTAAPSAGDSTAPRRTLRAFASEQDLDELFQTWAAEARRRRSEQGASLRKSAEVAGVAAAQAVPAPAAAGKGATQDRAESVTNVQHAGVDEGGIVKLHGDHLVILRRGRLFTVRVGGDALQPVAAIDAYGKGIDPAGAWYDEMLVSRDTVVVIGYSYARGGTEIGVFDIDRAGQLAWRASYHLRSNDYYSSRNYASRLVGSRLIVYSPHLLSPWSDPYAAFPALRKWRPGALPNEFQRIVAATRIYRTDEPLDPFAGVALHSVTICELATPEMGCASTAVLGPPGRVFYVSPSAVYVWASAPSRVPDAARGSESAVFRIPLDGSAPGALNASGSPIDQFAFHEDGDGMLNVMLRARGAGDGMWAAEGQGGGLALLRVPVASFGDGRDTAPAGSYRPLPAATGNSVHSRYIGPFLLYGAGSGWGAPPSAKRSPLYAVRYAQGSLFEVSVDHPVDRLEALGANALVVGGDGSQLHLTSIRLGELPLIVGQYKRREAAQGETRSHGFFYKAEGEFDGLLGLPIVERGEPVERQLHKASAAVLFVRNRRLQLAELGTLDARSVTANANDGCQASCVDWYGNTRPLFLGSRVFALLGYEVVEGTVRENRIMERRRVSFAPVTLAVAQ